MENSQGSRVKQVAGSSTFTYSYSGLNILYDKNVTGSTTTVTKHFYAAGLQVAKMVASSVYYLHQDALGSTRLETTSTVVTKFKSNYVPYGNNYAMTGKEVFMYTGKPYDSATGLYYLGARYYDDGIGRFVTEDSYLGDKNDPITLNLYIYARDNPERYVDPTGHYNGRSFTDFDDPTFMASLITVITPIGQKYSLAPTQTREDSATFHGVTVTLATSSTTFVYPDRSTKTYTATATTYTSFNAGELSTKTNLAGLGVSTGPAIGTTTTSGPTYALSAGNCFETYGAYAHDSLLAGLGASIVEIGAFEFGYEVPITTAGVTAVTLYIVAPLIFIGIGEYDYFNNVQCGS